MNPAHLGLHQPGLPSFAFSTFLGQARTSCGTRREVTSGEARVITIHVRRSDLERHDFGGHTYTAMNEMFQANAAPLRDAVRNNDREALRNLTFAMAHNVGELYIARDFILTTQGELSGGLGTCWKVPRSTSRIPAKETRWWSWAGHDYPDVPIGLLMAVSEDIGDDVEGEALQWVLVRILDRASRIMKAMRHDFHVIVMVRDCMQFLRYDTEAGTFLPYQYDVADD